MNLIKKFEEVFECLNGVTYAEWQRFRCAIDKYFEEKAKNASDNVRVEKEYNAWALLGEEPLPAIQKQLNTFNQTNNQ